MLTCSNISFVPINFRKVAVSTLLIGVTVFAFATIGGGGKNKSRIKSLQAGFNTIKTGTGFSLRAGTNYRGSMIIKEERSSNFIAYHSLITYQKGNSTYILPNKYKVSIAPNSNRSPLQLLNLKIKLCK